MMHVLGRIPQAADHFSVAGLRFEVMDMDRNRSTRCWSAPPRSTARRQAAEPATVGDIAATRRTACRTSAGNTSSA